MRRSATWRTSTLVSGALLLTWPAAQACVLAQDLGSTGNDSARSPAAPSGQGGSNGDSPDTTDASPPDSAPIGAPRDAAADRGDASLGCSAIIEIGQLAPSTCAFIDPVSHLVGHAIWDCAGGAAHLTIGDLGFEGTPAGATLDVSTCRDDPHANLSGHFEVVTLSIDLVAKAGALTYTRASGLACPKVYADCSATASVTLR